MTFKNILMLSFATCITTACISNVSGNINISDRNSQQNKPNSPNLPNHQGNPNASGLTTGYALSVPKSRRFAPKVFAVEGKGRGINEVKVGDTTVTLAYPGVISGNFSSFEDSSQKVIASGSDYKYTRFAYYKVKNSRQSGAEAVIANGKMTDITDVPTIGKVNYKGGALGVHLADGMNIKGKSVFEVDFGGKIVKGRVGDWYTSKFDPNLQNTITTGYPNIGNININATINGNTFGQNDAIRVNGALYGPQAAEIGGVVSASDVVAAFGAIKQ